LPRRVNTSPSLRPGPNYQDRRDPVDYGEEVEQHMVDLRSTCASIADQFLEDVKSGKITAGHSSAPSDDAIINWCESEIGVRLRSVPKVLAIVLKAVDSFRRKTRLRLAVLGPRGGGKTKLTATIELIAYRFFGYDWQNVGGSLEQAKLCYQYVRDAHLSSKDLTDFTLYTQTHDTRSRMGGSIKVSAASHTSVRGPHPVGPSGGGGLTLDEAAIIPDHICDAARGQLTSANPSALIQLSTMGEKQVGRFWDVIEDPQEKGYELRAFDIFDVAKKCPYDCKTTCPVREHFAEDYCVGEGATKQVLHAAYCGGRAHDVDGWVDVDEIAQHFRESTRENFERELLGKSVSAIGHVYDPRLIDEAALRGKSLAKDRVDHSRRFQLLEKCVGIDWGFAGQTAVCYAARLRDALLVYRWEFFSQQRYSIVREHVLKTCFEEHIEAIYPDSANPSDNEEMSNEAGRMAERNGIDWAPRVFPIVFSKFKAYGIGEVRRRLEKRELFFAPDFGGVEDQAFAMAMRYLKSYHTDDSGKPVKIDDHGPDALLCACVGFSQSFSAPSDPAALRR
jgi:hypothetical protein